jgi:two-component system sensor histidine kinase RpfC
MLSKPSSQRWFTLHGVKPMLHGVKAMIAWLAQRQELEQAIIRVGISAAVLAYVAWYVGRGSMTDGGIQALLVAFAFFAFAGAIAIRVLQAPRIAKARRILGIVVDNAVASYCLFALGEGAGVILFAYLFVTLGNGFRYGRLYLHISQSLSVAGFAVVMLVSPFWSQHTGIGLGFLITLIIVPIYVGALAGRISVARRRAEDANQAKERKIAELEEKIAERDRSSRPSQKETSATA